MNKPYKINNLIFKNRVIVPPMASQTATNKGFVTQKTIDHYKRLTKSNASMVMVEYSYISKQGKSEPNQLGINSDKQLKGLKKLSRTIKQSGAISAIQIVHAGGKSSRLLTESPLISPSGLNVPVKGQELETPSIADTQDIEKMKYEFILGALRGLEAGFDIIEIHAAHGYGLNQWLSPITNRRSDQYGGSLENRGRLLFEIIEGILKESPHAILSIRIPGQDHFDGGLTNSETLKISKRLKKLGVSIINVSSGIGGWRRPRNRTGEGYLLEDAEFIQKNIPLPVIGVGGIKTADFINEKVNNDSISFLAVGRAILNNENWGNEVGLIR